MQNRFLRLFAARNFGEERPSTIRQEFSLSVSKLRQRKFEQARSLLQQHLDTKIADLDQSHPMVVKCLYALALAHLGEGELEGALKYAEKVCEVDGRSGLVKGS